MTDRSLVLPLLDTAPSYKRVATAIEREIMEGRLSVGDLLPTEGDLAVQMGVHRSTVREGLRSLENAGLIVRAGAKRLIVSIPDRDHVSRMNTRALGLSRVSFKELWEVQMELEPFSARLAGERISNPLKLMLAANVDQLEEKLQDDEAVVRNDIVFHRLIAEAAGNAALAIALAPISVLLFSATVELYRRVAPARHRLLGAHRKIAAAVISGDQKAAEEWMTRHIQDFKRGYGLSGLDMDAAITLDSRSLAKL